MFLKYVLLNTMRQYDGCAFAYSRPVRRVVCQCFCFMIDGNGGVILFLDAPGGTCNTVL